MFDFFVNCMCALFFVSYLITITKRRRSKKVIVVDLFLIFLCCCYFVVFKPKEINFISRIEPIVHPRFLVGTKKKASR